MLRGLKFHFDNEYITEPVSYGPVLLWQIGDIGCDPGYVVKDHQQYCYEITCVVGGRGLIAGSGGEYPIHKGQLFLNRPKENHRIRSDMVEPIRYFYLGFDFDRTYLDATWKTVKRAFDECGRPLADDIFEISAVFSGIFDEMMGKDAVTKEIIRCRIYEILLLAYRAFTQKKPQRYLSGSESDRHSQLVYSVIHYIDANVCAIDCLQEIGSQVGYSYTYISRLFTRVTGRSLQTYYNEKRFDKAVSFLKMGMPSKEIAVLLKYKTLSSFSKAFSNHFGVSPSEYRKRLRQQEEGAEPPGSPGPPETPGQG
ncbi:MAG TPA: AraC family transcriptional regulator [Firmicutes bacterium]|nr:AraC family transcriptional regulator [Bacillota bacterium]